MTTESKELVTLESVSTLTVFEADKVPDIIAGIRKAALDVVFDVTKKKEREACKSHAYKVSQAKAVLVKLAKDSSDEHYRIYKAVTSVRTDMERQLDALNKEVKKPALDWEADEQARKDKLARIKLLGSDAHNLDEKEVESCLRSLGEMDLTALQEFQQDAEILMFDTVEVLNNQKTALQEQAKKDAELKRLQEEAEKRKADDDKRIADENAKKAEADRKEQDRLDDIKAKEDADKAEEKRLADIDQAKKDSVKETEDRLNKEQADRDAVLNRAAAADRSKELADRNAELERQADKDHRAKVRTEAVEAISGKIEVSLHDAATLINAIEQGEISHVTLNF